MEIIEGQDLVIDVGAWEVILRGDPVDLTKTEFQLLVALAARPRRVVTNEELTELLWGAGWYGDDGNISVHISKLRAKLGESGIKQRFIRTVRGVGYRFEPEPDSTSGRGSPPGEDPRHVSASLVVDLDRRVLWVSRSIHELLGWEPSDLLGIRPRDLLHPEDAPAALDIMEDVDAGAPRLICGRVQSASGDYRSLAMAVRPMQAANGDVVGFVAEWQSIEDAGDSDDVKEIPQASPASSVDGRHPVTLIFDADFRLREIAPRVPLWDWEPDELIGRFFSPSGRSEETQRSAMAAMLAVEARDFHGAVNFRCKDGRLIPVDSRTYIDADDEGNLRGYRTVLFLSA